jgi:hypothetical protein
MDFLSENAATDEASGDASKPEHIHRRSAVVRSEKRLAALRLALVQEKRKLHDASAREQAVREGVVGRAVWALVEQGLLDPSVTALIRDEVRSRRTLAQGAAFANTAFE